MNYVPFIEIKLFYFLLSKDFNALFLKIAADELS